jgi:hypothetical protein
MHRFVLPFLALACAAGRAGAQDCRALVERAIQAHGGLERLARWQAVSSRSRGTLHAGGGVDFTAESFTQLPAQMRTVLRFRANGQDTVQTQVLNGDRAWSDVNGQAKELDAPAVRELQEAVYAERVAGLVVLRQPGFTLSPLPERSVAGRPALGVKVAAAGHRDLGLYFDKGSGLLVRTEVAVRDPASGQEVPQEKVYGAFQDIDGVQRPTRVIVYREGKVYLEVEVVEIKPVERLPDRLFSLP